MGPFFFHFFFLAHSQQRARNHPLHNIRVGVKNARTPEADTRVSWAGQACLPVDPWTRGPVAQFSLKAVSHRRQLVTLQAFSQMYVRKTARGFRGGLVQRQPSKPSRLCLPVDGGRVALQYLVMELAWSSEGCTSSEPPTPMHMVS